MPELPEIAHYKKYANEALLLKEVVEIAFGDSKPLQETQKSFRETFQNHKFTTTEQLGKYLFIKNDTNKWLVKFGKVWIADSVVQFQKKHSLGPDALDISKSDFLKRMEKQTVGIKSVLMNQHKIAGIGNVYTDEILFQSHIHPKTKVSNLSEKELKDIYTNISQVFKKATNFIAEDKKAPDSWLKSHRNEGDNCPKCEGKVKKIQVGGRSTYFCEECQKEGN